MAAGTAIVALFSRMEKMKIKLNDIGMRLILESCCWLMILIASPIIMAKSEVNAIIEAKQVVSNDVSLLPYSSEDIIRGDQTSGEAPLPYTGDRLDLNFTNIRTADVLQILADFKSLNLVVSDSVTGTMSLSLNQVPWDQALDVILRSGGLDARKEGNILEVATLEELEKGDAQRLRRGQSTHTLAPLETYVVRLKYSDAALIHNMLSERDKNENTLLSNRGSIIVDQRTNTLIVNDVAERIAEIQDLLDLIDIPIRQVLMEAKIVIATSDFRREFGVNWGFMGTRSRSDGNRVGFSGRRDAMALSGGVFDSLDKVSLDDSLVADLGVQEATTSFSLGYLTDNILLDLELSALEADGVVEIVSQPSVVSADKQKAMIKSGVEIPYQTTNQNGSNTMTNIQFKEAVLQLEITPQITPDNQVIMDIMVKQDSIASFSVNGEPAISVNELVNQAIVADQQTLVIGGIFHSEEFNDSTKVPVMGDLPLLGNLFKKQMRTVEKREILIFITPKIIEERV